MTHYPNSVSRVHKGKTFSCTLGDFEVDCKLVLPAAIKGDDWKETADYWAVTLKRGNDRVATLDYWTGVGNRNYPKSSDFMRRTLYDIENSKAVKPSAADILYSLVGDAQCHIEARDYEYPEDYYMMDMGYDSVKAAREVMHGCRNSHNKLATQLGLDESAIYALSEALQEGGY